MHNYINNFTYIVSYRYILTFFTISIRMRSGLLVLVHSREAKNGQTVSEADPKSPAVLHNIMSMDSDIMLHRHSN